MRFGRPRTRLALCFLLGLSASGWPAVTPRAADAPPARSGVTVWIAGDSTVATRRASCPSGWGGELSRFLQDGVEVVNSAVGGRSVRTWLYHVQTEMDASGECVLDRDPEGNPLLQQRWQDMLDGMKPGDYLFIQFGINDTSPTCDRHVGTEAFKAEYGMMARAAQQRGTQPVFVTPVSSISCRGDRAQPTRGRFATATREAGEELGVPVIDLEAASVALYQLLDFCPLPAGEADVSATTPGAVGEFFCDDHTHFDDSGAAAIARLVVQGVRDLHLGLEAQLAD